MKRFRSILTYVDTLADEHWALEWASKLARHTGAKLHLVDVLPDFAWLVRATLPNHEHVHDLLLAEKQEKLKAVAELVQGEGLQVSWNVLTGRTSTEVVREVLRHKHDLVVRTAKGSRSGQSGFLGTTSTRLLRQCPCPVWIVKPGEPPAFKHVMAAVDAGPVDAPHFALSKQILELSKSIYELEHGKLSVVHAWELYAEDVLLSRMSPEEVQELKEKMKVGVEESLDRLLSDCGLSVRSENVHILYGEVGASIVHFAKQHDVDLLVMGTVARSGISGLLMGNTAEHILSRIECSLLALKPADFVSPVELE
jgi:nucleotide-binding universal stress UspA family protein